MTCADYQDYWQNGTPFEGDKYKWCDFCGLYDEEFADHCFLVAGRHPEFETTAANWKLAEDFSDSTLRGWDFIEFYGQPVADSEEWARHLPERAK